MASDGDILQLAKDCYKEAKEGWADIYRRAILDLEFLSDKEFAQWDERQANSRRQVGKPIIEADQLSQFVHQVVNDIRMNTPHIKIIPADDGADDETAEIIQGRVRAIEYKSNADSAYDMAADFSVKSSIGFITVDHDYATSGGFEQELCIKRVINPQAILIDPNSIEPDGSDAGYAFIFDDMPLKKFQKKYPKFSPVSFGDNEAKESDSSQNCVTIADFFIIDNEIKEIGLLEDGSTEEVADGRSYKNTRSVSKRVVSRYKVCGDGILESSKFPGEYVPVVPVYGEESWVNGRRHLLSLIRKAKSSQMGYNLLKSLETEILLKQQQSPVMAAVGQMRGFEEDWQTPDKAMVLYYHTTDANGRDVPMPQRIAPPVVSSGFANASLDMENNIRKTLGMYNASVGKREGGASGVALKQLEISGDMASVHFSDNLMKSIAQVGKIIVSALPEIEDTPRTVTVIDAEDKAKRVGINGEATAEQKRKYYFTQGKYDVRVVPGPAFTTLRQESADFYNNIITQNPQLMSVIGDLVFKYQDAPGAQAISERMKKMISPELLENDEQQNPELDAFKKQTAAIVEQLQGQIAALTGELQSREAQDTLKAADMRLKELEIEGKRIELAIKQQNAAGNIGAGENEKLALEREVAQRELAIKEAEVELKAAQMLFEMNRAHGAPTLGATENLQMLQSKIAALTAQKEQEEMAQLAIQEREAQKAAEEKAEEEAKRMQAEQLLMGLNSIRESLDALVQGVTAPIEVVRDSNGNMIGAK